jgi:nucleoside-diphosphate-sugar epimerase
VRNHHQPAFIGTPYNVSVVDQLDSTTDWTPALHHVDTVIHLAARVHVMHDNARDKLAAYREVNVAGTLQLAKQAAETGVRRLVYLSTLKVNGEQTFTGTANSIPHGAKEYFTSADVAAPQDEYAVSKWEAEQALWDVSANTGLEVVVVRPPLVYGPGVKGNFLRLMQLVERGVPLPLGSVTNRRSLIGIDNLTDLLIRCMSHPHAAGQTFLVSDGEDLSTPALIETLAREMGKSPRLFPVPLSLLRMAGRMSGKLQEIERLVGSLQVDCAHTCSVLGWNPPVPVEEGLRKAVDWFLIRK